MTYTYPAIFHKEKDSVWCEFPDLDGCQTYGTTEKETYDDAALALANFLEYLMEKGKDIPLPSDIGKIKTGKNSFTSYVSCAVRNKEKSVRKAVTIPEWMNRRAKSMGLNFSQILQDALLTKFTGA